MELLLASVLDFSYGACNNKSMEERLVPHPNTTLEEEYSMKHEVEITAGAIRHIHPSMAFQGIEEGKVVVVAVGTLESLDSYPEPISVAVSDCEDYLDDDLSPDEIRKSLWVVYIEDRGLNCLLIDDFIDHTTPL